MRAFSRPVITVALAACTSAPLACSSPPPSEDATRSAGQEIVTSSREPGIQVDAHFRRVYVGTPTYGYEPTAPLLTVEVIVDDAVVRDGHPGFDGMERVFALAPRRVDGATEPRRLELPFLERRLRGYIQLYSVDAHALTDLRLSEDDLGALLDEGIAIGIETNIGTLWAQSPGQNFAVTKTGPL